MIEGRRISTGQWEFLADAAGRDSNCFYDWSGNCYKLENSRVTKNGVVIGDDCYTYTNPKIYSPDDHADIYIDKSVMGAYCTCKGRPVVGKYSITRACGCFCLEIDTGVCQCRRYESYCNVCWDYPSFLTCCDDAYDNLRVRCGTRTYYY